MQHKLKRILKLNIFALGMLVVLTNCQTEDLVLKTDSITKSRAVVTNLNFKEFLEQQNVKSTVEKLKKIELTKISNSKNGRNTNRSTVTIDSSSINQVIMDGVISYTFKVINNDLEVYTFENLVIQTDTTQQTNAYLIKYTPSISLDNGVPFQGIKELTPLDSSTTINTTNKTTVCISITTYYNHYLCDQGVVWSPETCEYQYTTQNTETSCETLPEGNIYSTVFYSNPSSGGGGSPTPDSDYDGSDTGIHGNGGTPINTAPLFDDPNPKKDPCDLIKKIQDDTNFKNRMALLIDAARLWSFERCYVMYNATTPSTPNNYSYQSFQGAISSPESGYTGDTTMQGIIHSHYNGLISIFSSGDIQDLYFKLKNYPDITDDFFMGVVTSSNTAYLLQIPDRAAFIAFGDKYLADDEKFKDFMIETMGNKYNINPNNSNSVNELGFLKMMANLNMGVSLASVDFNASTTSTGAVFNTWTKKEYYKKTRTVIPSNCN